MGIIEFFLLVLIVVVLAALCVWCIQHFAPSTPGIVIRIVWGVAVLIIVVALLKAFGLWGADPQIPRLR